MQSISGQMTDLGESEPCSIPLTGRVRTAQASASVGVRYQDCAPEDVDSASLTRTCRTGNNKNETELGIFPE